MSNDNGNNRFCLTKADLADTVFISFTFDKVKSSEIVEDFLELLKGGLEKDGKVMISGFGAYEVNQKGRRRGINPQTKDPLMLRPRKVIKFRPSLILKNAMNNVK
jgi:nucleoid DNA-binding protein